MKIKTPVDWLCRNCGTINPSIKPHRKRKEYYRKCPNCGYKREYVAL